MSYSKVKFLNECFMILIVGPFFLIWSVQNSIAWAYQSTQALPASTVVLLLLMWIGGKFKCTFKNHFA